MTDTPDQLAALARSQIGTNEAPPGSNDTPYGLWFGWNGVAWCVIFFMWVYNKGGAVLPVRTASVTALYDFCEANGLLLPRGATPSECDGVLRTWTGKQRHEAGFDSDQTHCQMFLGNRGSAWDLIGGNQNAPSGGEVSYDTATAWSADILGVIDTERYLAHAAAHGTTHDITPPSKLSPSHPNPRPMLYEGMPVTAQTKAWVTRVQATLNLLGPDQDGVFGPKTDGRVRGFQGQNGLTVDGVVGPLTYTALKIGATP